MNLEDFKIFMTRVFPNLIHGGLLFLVLLMPVNGQTKVRSASVTPDRFINGDGSSKNVTLTVELNSGKSINISVSFRSDINSPTSTFINNHQILDNGDNDNDGRSGIIRTVLPKQFDSVGIYHVRITGMGGALAVVHEPKETWLGAFIKVLLGAARGGTRDGEGSVIARLDEKPITNSILVREVPKIYEEVDNSSLKLKIKSAMMPSWSSDSKKIVCTAWRSEKWLIAGYDYKINGELTENWKWNPASSNSTGDFSPVWSPDGQNVAFIRRLPDNKTDIWLLHFDNQQRPLHEVRLTNIGTIHQLIKWDPDFGILFESINRESDSSMTREVWSLEARRERSQPAGNTVARTQSHKLLRGWVGARRSLIYDNQNSAPPLSVIREIASDGSERSLFIGANCAYRWISVSNDGALMALDSNCQ